VIDPTKALLRDSAQVPINVKRKDPKPTRKKRETPAAVAKAKKIATELIDYALAEDGAKLAKIEERLARADIPPRAVYEAFKNFESAVGGRSQLATTLQHCPPSSLGYHLIRQLMADPDFLRQSGDNTAYTLDILCQRKRLPFNALVQAFRDGAMARMAIDSLTRVSESVPKIVEQLTTDATNRYEECPRCRGTKRTPIIHDGEYLVNEEGDIRSELCHKCRGEGMVYAAHDVQSRKLALQIAGVTNEKPLVQQTFNQRADVSLNFVPGDSSYENIMKAVDRTINPLASRDDILEAEIVDAN
jgi:hypothetical protein